jgi:trans-aconitate methyltransferase
MRGRGLSQEIFDLLYTIKRDPWKYRTSELEQTKYQDVLNALPSGKIGRTAELGCSEGVFTKMLAPKVGSLLAVDFSPTALARAKMANSTNMNVEYHQMDIASDNLEGRFELIIASEVLYYLGQPPEIQAVGQKLVASLVSGGHLLLCHMRSTFDEQQGIALPPWVPNHPGARTVHGLFDQLDELERISDLERPLYKVTLYKKPRLAR